MLTDLESLEKCLSDVGWSEICQVTLGVSKCPKSVPKWAILKGKKEKLKCNSGLPKS